MSMEVRTALKRQTLDVHQQQHEVGIDEYVAPANEPVPEKPRTVASGSATEMTNAEEEAGQPKAKAQAKDSATFSFADKSLLRVLADGESRSGWVGPFRR